MPAKRHLVAAAFAVACLGVEVAAVGVAPAQEAPGASVDKVGWWNATRGPQAGEPDNPVRPALAPVPAPPTNVPDNGVGVAATVGEPTKVAAVGLLLDAAAGATVDTLKLTLKEAPAPGANAATDQAKIVACPITGFWGETRNGNWIDRPQADCNLGSAAGTRGADGTWTFDLTSMAAVWLDESGPGQNGVLLSEAVDAPGGFEASFLDPAAGGMTLEFSAGGGGATDTAADPFAAGGDIATAPLPVDSGAGLDLGRADALPIAPAPVPAAPAASGSAVGDGGATPARPRTARPAAATPSRAGDLVGNLSPATLLLVPAALALALVLSLALGDTSLAAASRRRLGGVARALSSVERS